MNNLFPCSALRVLALLLSGISAASAQFNFTTLHHFGESPLIGQRAHPLSRGPDGTLYGITEFGGAGGATLYGILYSLSPDGSTRTILREFGSVTNGGSQPIGTVVPTAGGRIYGVTRRGGANNRGVIYGVNTNGAGFAVVHDLPPGAGAENYRLMEASDGRIYGLGGAEGVIAFDANGGGFSVLYSNANTRFTSFDSLFEGQDGSLYIVASIDSVDVSDGAVYRLSRDGSSFTVLRSRIPFRGVIGDGTPAPCCAFQSADGFIYGAEDVGGDSFFFRTDTNVATSVTGWVEQGALTLLGFQHLPTAFFQASDGRFYGSFSQPYAFAPQGYLFRWDSWNTLATTRTNLVNWPASVGGPFAAITDKTFLEGADGRFYGVASGGGRHGAGLIFRVDKGGTGFTHLHEFIPNDGSNAAPPVILGSDGYLYGTTREGGIQDLGTIYRVRPDGTDYNMIRQFFSRDEGADPAGGVIDGNDGFLYGATASGGSQNLGVVFKLRYDGSEFAVVYNIRTNRPNATSPIDPTSITGSLVMDTNGWLYGVGTTGGSAGRGGVFRAQKDGSLFTILHNFIVGEARRPVGGLTLALDSRLWGTTENGGANDSGVLYRLNTDGTGFQILRAFGGTNDGANPNAPLWQASGGVFYGTTFGGGTNNLGTVFRYNPVNSNYAVLHHFGAGTDGRRPSAGLVEAADGSLVGATRFGGSGGAGQQLGTLFKLNKDGSGYEVLRSFTGAGGDGESVFSTLARGVGNTFYGTTSLGGNRDIGTVFTFSLGGTAVPLTIAPTNTTLRSAQTRTFNAAGGTPPYTFSFGQNLSGGAVDPASGLYTAGPTDTVLDTVRVTDSLAATTLATIAVAPLNLVINASTPQEFLDLLTHVEGNLVLDNADTLTALLLPNLTSVTGDLIIQNNDQLQALDLGALQTVGGNFIVASNVNLSNVSAQVLTVVVGAVDVTGNAAATGVDLASLTSVGGSADISDNDSVTGIDLGSLTTVGGDIDVTGNIAASGVDLASLMTVGGSIDVTANTAATGIDLRALTSVGGDVDVTGNAAATGIDLGSLTSVGGSIDVTDNTSVSGIDLGSLATVGGAVDVTGNSTVTGVDLSSLNSIGGNVTISSNAPNTTTDLGSLSNTGNGTNAATITLDGGTFTLASGLNIGTNATLGGQTTFAGSVTNRGTISPGASPGRFDITGGLALNGSSALRLELGGYAPGQSDFLSVAGSVTLGGTLAVSVINHFALALTNGASFTLLTAGGPITGAFANVPSGGTLTTTDGFARFTVLYAGQSSVRLTDLVLLDKDGDGSPDARELAAGTDPANPASVFRIVSLQTEAGGVRLTWSTVGGKGYVVQTNGSLIGPFTDSIPLIIAPGVGESTTNHLDANQSTGAARYYRVRLEP